MTIVGSGALYQARSLAVAAAFTSITAFGCPGPTSAQVYPTKVVRIVLPFPGGGPLDFVARLLTDKLSASLKQPFIVDNRPGAAGNIGTEAVARAAPDGYVLLLVLDTPLTVNPALYKKLPFDPERDFSPISVVAGFSQMLVVHPSIPVNSPADFVALARKQSERPMIYGSGGGNGSPGQLTMEYFRMRAGFPAIHVPYRGNAQVVTDLIGGQVLAGFVATPGVLQHVREGRLKALAVSSAQRAQLAPEVPTMIESGYSGFDVGFYQVMLAPAGVPESIRVLLEREVQQALRSPDLREKLRTQGLDAVGSTGAEAKSRLKADAERWSDVVKAADIKPD
jgi:tripartite-type tricarboxylate transporter receptor subunit TctC